MVTVAELEPTLPAASVATLSAVVRSLPPFLTVFLSAAAEAEGQRPRLAALQLERLAAHRAVRAPCLARRVTWPAHVLSSFGQATRSLTLPLRDMCTERLTMRTFGAFASIARTAGAGSTVTAWVTTSWTPWSSVTRRRTCTVPGVA